MFKELCAHSGLAGCVISRAAEQQRAFAYARKALSVDQQNASAFNTLAILYRRIGGVTKAESIYQAQITSGTRQRPLFYRNYLVLLVGVVRESTTFRRGCVGACRLRVKQREAPFRVDLGR